ncbi:c-type cytochrome [Pseudomonas sp. SL4(2022)]|uniref:c-type cytochrome n=1 Tax=Pseudomonas sp. SL4(2022) TaxID=2994661 RepID=UPI00226E9AFE|nr:c-type cytochrome [Pseudomonas sp. SL4(2022)]WAC46451.1 c-type cytochrome [Pseudomonas sp. SL4(2022)]
MKYSIAPIICVAFFSGNLIAGDTAAGGKVFSANCAACHAGGKNVIMPKKDLSEASLSNSGMFETQAIYMIVANGKNAMPAFGGRLSAEDIDDVASYVLMRAQEGWK